MALFGKSHSIRELSGTSPLSPSVCRTVIFFKDVIRYIISLLGLAYAQCGSFLGDFEWITWIYSAATYSKTVIKNISVPIPSFRGSKGGI